MQAKLREEGMRIDSVGEFSATSQAVTAMMWSPSGSDWRRE